MGYIRDWLEMPISACVNESTSIPKKMGGLGISSFKHLAQKMCLLKRHSLRSSTNADIQQVWSTTSYRHVTTDELLLSQKSIKAAVKSLRTDQHRTAVAHLLSLSIQGATSRCVIDAVQSKNIELWVTTLENSSSLLFNFARKAMLQVLPTASNLVRWRRSLDPTCPLCGCGRPQTNKHVLSNCGATTALHRYTTRHNAVLAELVTWLRSAIAVDQELYADLPNAQVLPVCDLFNNCRPDIAISDHDTIHALELTVCHETNLVSSRSYKQEKYKNLVLCGSTLAAKRRIVPHFIEVSTLGFISDVSHFTKAIKIPLLPNSVKFKIIATVLINSFSIYCRRNKSAVDTD